MLWREDVDLDEIAAFVFGPQFGGLIDVFLAFIAYAEFGQFHVNQSDLLDVGGALVEIQGFEVERAGLATFPSAGYEVVFKKRREPFYVAEFVE